MDYVKRAREVLETEIAGLMAVRDELGSGFEDVVRILLDSLNQGGKLVVSGVGKNLHIGQKLAATFTSTGAPAVVLHPADAMHGDLGILNGHDVLIALSYSGESEELIRLVPMARRRGTKVVSITGAPGSSLARHSDAVITAAVAQEACPFNMVPTASTTAALAVGDALAMVLLEARGFNQEDYAKLHPGGTIGRTLLLRVADVMRTGDRLATIPSGATIRDAVVAMTGCRAGAVAIVDDRHNLLGIFTDGDLRRHLNDADRIHELSIDAVMTRNPITIREEDLAVDILRIFEKHNIDDLIVLDADGKVVGQVDIQDLPKLKIL